MNVILDSSISLWFLFSLVACARTFSSSCIAACNVYSMQSFNCWAAKVWRILSFSPWSFCQFFCRARIYLFVNSGNTFTDSGWPGPCLQQAPSWCWSAASKTTSRTPFNAFAVVKFWANRGWLPASSGGQPRRSSCAPRRSSCVCKSRNCLRWPIAQSWTKRCWIFDCRASVSTEFL